MLQQIGHIFPEEFAAIHDFAAPNVEQIDGKTACFVVVSKHVGVVAQFGSGDSLLFLKLMNRRKLITQARSRFKLLILSCCSHAGCQGTFQLGVAPFKEELGIANGIPIEFRRRQSFNAGSETAMNVVLQTGTRMKAG